MRITWSTILLRLLAVAALSLFFVGASGGDDSGGCSASDGKAGKVSLIYTTDATVTALNLTQFGLPVSSTALTVYPTTSQSATISWTAGPTYAASLSLPAEPGDPGKCKSEFFIFQTCENGSDGGDRTYLLEFSGGTVTASLLVEQHQGVTF